MSQYKGYLITAHQAINFLEWYLKNPLKNQFPWAYNKKDYDVATNTLKLAKDNPKDFFFGNMFNAMIGRDDKPNESYRTDAVTGRKDSNGLSVDAYVKHLKRQTLVPYGQIQKMADKVQNGSNQHENHRVKKDNRVIKKHNAKLDQQITQLAHNYNASVDVFEKYFGNYDGEDVDRSTGEPLLTTVKSLLNKSTKQSPNHKELNKEILDVLNDFHITQEQFVSLFVMKHGFMYGKTHQVLGFITHTKLDIYEAIAVTVEQKEALAKSNLGELRVPRMPAFKKDINNDKLRQYTVSSNRVTKKGCPREFEDYITDPNKIADYDKVSKTQK